MIKTYGYTDNTQLSPHFNAQEFRCKCGKAHDFQIDDDLITKLEALYAALNCSKIIVTSGFRCSAHDKAVKGSGTGQHARGKAADICCYGQDGQPISSKTVCCKAQDIGFGGIAIPLLPTSIRTSMCAPAESGTVMRFTATAA